jgi:hypothetical protein
MITCPWCGTSHERFQQNCGSCGGPLPALSPTSENDPTVPPPAPRAVPRRYKWSLWLTNGWLIAAGIFALLGAIFTLVGLVLFVIFALVGIEILIGLPFVAVGILFLGVGLPIIVWRYGEVRRATDVLRLGEATLGQVVTVDQNYFVRINRRHPWVITYRFQAIGREYRGKTTSLNPAAAELQPGQAIYVLYLPDNPHKSVPYPPDGVRQIEYV